MSRLEVLNAEFRRKLQEAKNTGPNGPNDQIWLEAAPEIILHYNPRGLGKGVKYFNIEGVYVCETGKMEECWDDITMQLGRKVFGASEAMTNG